MSSKEAAEAAIARLMDAGKSVSEIHGDEALEIAQALRDHRLAELEGQVPRWVSVGEQLPKEKQLVWVCWADNVTLGRLMPQFGCPPYWESFVIGHSSSSDEWAWPLETASVTHWQPLSYPPSPGEVRSTPPPGEAPPE